MARGKTSEQGAIARRQLLALDLRISGLSFRAIADKLDVSHQQIFRDVENELERLAGLRADKAETLRELELQRLDKIINSLDSWVSSGNVGAVNAWIKASERRAKLLGLDAPTKVAPTNPDGTEPFNFEIKTIDYRAAILAPIETGSISDSDPSGESESARDGAALG